MQNVNNKYSEGLWFIDEDKNMACRYSKGHLIEVPVTTEILEEIKRQIEAAEVFEAFQNIDIQNEHILGYLNVILRDYVNFLGIDKTNVLINKMKLLANENIIDDQNTIFMNSLSSCLESSDIDTFDDLLEQFYNYNQHQFENAFTEEKSVGRSV